jgi:type III pantothenate kinase
MTNMPVTVCFDFGNTRLKCAVFSGKELKEIVVLENGDLPAIEKIVDRFKPDRTILSSVIQHDPEIENWLRNHSAFHKLDHLSKIPISTPVGKPETIGSDRLALMVGAQELFPGKNNLVVGLGSAITYNFINKYGQFLGGGISPGMEMRLRSLHEFTAKLPLVKADWNFPLIGYDTRTNILSGVILGMAREIDGIISEYEAKYENFNVLLSGGDAEHFSRLIKSKIFVEPNLMYIGLMVIGDHNL